MSIITRCSIKNTTVIFFILCICCLNSVVNNAYAVPIPANGNPTVYKDLNTPNDDYYGGTLAGQPVNGTNLTFIIENSLQNIVRDIFGGSRSVPGVTAMINGDILLNVNNTTGRTLAGGNQHNGGDSIINGSIFLTVDGCTFDDILGGNLGNNGSFAPQKSINLDIRNTIINNNLIVSGNGGVPAGVNVNLEGNIYFNMTSSIAQNVILLGTDYSVLGDINANILNSRIHTLTLLDTGAVTFGEANVSIGPGTEIFNLYTHSMRSGFLKNLNLVIEDADILNDLVVGTDDTNSIPEINVTLNGGYIKRFLTAVPNPAGAVGIFNLFNFTMYDGIIDVLSIGATDPAANNAVFKQAVINLHGGYIDKFYLGSPILGQARTRFISLNIYGGEINSLDVHDVEFLTLDFLPGENSIISEYIKGVNPVGALTVHQNAKTCWGEGLSDKFAIEVNLFRWGGEIQIPESTTLEIEISDAGLFVADGGSLAPIDLYPNNNQPILTLLGDDVIVQVKKPLSVNLDHSPDLIGGTKIPFIGVEDSFVNLGLFTTKNRTGLIWSDLDYDFDENLWYLNNVQISKDYYAYSSAREASSWLRQKHLYTTQRHSYNSLIHKHDGLWVDVQGGVEDNDVAVGSSEMPWVMASIGYDYKNPLLDGFIANIGFSFGFAQGWHKWNLANRVKNNISIGMVDAYLGLAHESGLYGTLTAQLSASRIKTKNPGFITNTQWNEIVPIGALELGWHYKINTEFSITPRAQVIGEMLSKQTIKVPYSAGKETVTLKKSTTLTTVLGVVSTYAYSLWDTPTDLQASIDWIRGIVGDYASHSKVFDKTFKEKNDSDTVRISLGLKSYITEDIDVGLQIFGDVINDRGYGGQASFTYKF